MFLLTQIARSTAAGMELDYLDGWLVPGVQLLD